MYRNDPPQKKVRFRNDPLPPTQKKKKKSTNLHTPKSITFRKFLTKNNAPNLNINENIGLPPPPPPDSHCLGTPTTRRVSLCTISIQ